jgi:hypothetical protein
MRKKIQTHLFIIFSKTTTMNSVAAFFFRASVLSDALGAYKVFIEGVVVETSKQDHLIGNSKG